MLTQNILAYTKGLSVKLQGRYVDIARAHQDIESVMCDLKECRSKVDGFYNRVYQDGLLLCETVGIEESRPRLAGRQIV